METIYVTSPMVGYKLHRFTLLRSLRPLLEWGVSVSVSIFKVPYWIFTDFFKELDKRAGKVSQLNARSLVIFLNKTDQVDIPREFVQLRVKELRKGYDLARDGIPPILGAVLAIQIPVENKWLNRICYLTNKFKTYIPWPNRDETVRLIRDIFCTPNRGTIKFWTGSKTIDSSMVGHTFPVYKGGQHVFVFVTEEMVGYRLGKFKQCDSN